jgi:DNA-binding SARP family transcriptional activator
VTLTIALLGAPSVSRRGQAAERPRGTKTWALLTVLAVTPGPVPRSRLAELLFGGAEDPLGALRWTTSQLRRLLGPTADITGDPLALRLPPNAVIDIEVLRAGRWSEAIGLPGLGRPLLEGVSTGAGAAFELWLEVERRRLGAATEAVLHEGALATLADGELEPAIDLASRLVGLNPYDENAQALLVRCLATAGDRDGAANRVRAGTELFRSELGIDPSPALAAAADVTPPEPRIDLTSATVKAQLDAGRAAVDAGAGDQGVGLLRLAVEGTRRLGDDPLLARAALDLGVALVHDTRGTDEEAVAVLHEVLRLAASGADRDTEAVARREIGYVEFLRGQYDRALSWSAQAQRLADDDDHSLKAWNGALSGSCLADLGRHGEALATLDTAMAEARAGGDLRAFSYAATAAGRSHHLRGEAGDATTHLETALAAARDGGWTSFTPWPEGWLAMVSIGRGRLDHAQELLDHAYALGCQVGDLCWQSLGLAGLGRLAQTRGDGDRAIPLLIEAGEVGHRLSDTYVWVEAFVLDTLVEVGLAAEDERVPTWLDRLITIAGRSGMRELMVRAELHRAAAGSADALDVARLLAEGVDNPALDADVTRAVEQEAARRGMATSA